MTPRKKKGIGVLGGGVLSIVAGIVLLATTSTPDWLPIIIQVVGAVASILGFAIVYPDIEE